MAIKLSKLFSKISVRAFPSFLLYVEILAERLGLDQNKLIPVLIPFV